MFDDVTKQVLSCRVSVEEQRLSTTFSSIFDFSIHPINFFMLVSICSTYKYTLLLRFLHPRAEKTLTENVQLSYTITIKPRSREIFDRVHRSITLKK